MTKLHEELAKLRNSFDLINGLAKAIDLEPKNTPDSRHKARHIQRKSDEIFEQLTEIFKLPAKDPNASLGAVAEAAGCERKGEQQ